MLIFSVLMILVLIRLFVLAIRLSWGIATVLFRLILLPFFLVFLVLKGLVYLAVPLLILIGIFAFLPRLN